MPKILVTGCAGFVGSAIYRHLFKNYYIVSGVDNLHFSDGHRLKGYDFTIGHFLNTNYNDYDIIIHCATSNIIYQINNPVQTFKNNAYDTIELFSKFNGYIINISTASVYGNVDSTITENTPYSVSNAYDTSKLIAELYLFKRKNFITLRLSNVYGYGQDANNPYSGVIGKFIGSALKNDPINIIGDGKQTRDFTFISDVVNAVVLAINTNNRNSVYNISTGVATSINELAELIIKQSNSKSNIIYSEKRPIDTIDHRKVSYHLANRDLKYVPETNIETGILRTIKWMQYGSLM